MTLESERSRPREPLGQIRRQAVFVYQRFVAHTDEPFISHRLATIREVSLQSRLRSLLLASGEMATTPRSAVCVLVASTALYATACTPRPITEEGAGVANLYNIFLAIAAVIFLLVTGLIAWSLIRYRAKDDDGLPEQVHTNVKLEVVWFAIPSVIVAVLFILSAGVLSEVNEENPEDGTLVVSVEGFQWGWRFTYPGGETTTSLPESPATVPLPVDTPITFELVSPDVIHSFYVPRMLLKRDVVPGRTNRIDVVIEEVGTYGGKCAEFCGLLHDDMDLVIEAVEPEDFDALLDAMEVPDGD